MIDVDLIKFVLNREHTPQWIVYLNEVEIAVVTERVIATPPYLLCWPDGRESKHEDRDGVMEAVLAELSAKHEDTAQKA